MADGSDRGRVIRLVMVVIVSLACLDLGLGITPVAAADPASVVFDQLHAASDAGGQLWGELLLERDEPYQEGAAGARPVRYYAKGRMELTRPTDGVAGISYGRLVHALVTGGLAVGDARLRQYAGADLPVAGDRDRAANPEAPTYRSLRVLLGRAASAVGRPVEAVLLPPEGAGVASAVVATRRDPALGQLAVNAVYLDGPGHNVPDVFWAALTAQGAAGGRGLTWTALYGWPLTEAVWVRAREGGRPVDALVQLFERRTLIYWPAAPAGQRVTAGDVGRDYLRWRDHPTTPPPDLAPPPSRNGLALPAVGEAGTIFLLAAAGFKDGEVIDSWLEIERAVFPQRLALRPGGVFLGRLRTTPVASGATEIRVVVQGRTSGHVAVIQVRVLATDALTPGAEAAEPTTAPDGQHAGIAPGLLEVGGVGALRAEGFAPGEPITAWVTTGLNRVIPYPVYVASLARSAANPDRLAVERVLTADAAGLVRTGLPGPGVATSGVYAVTLVGDRSGHTAIAYFRARAGAPLATNYLYGVPPPAPARLGGATPPTGLVAPVVEVDTETPFSGALAREVRASNGPLDASRRIVRPGPAPQPPNSGGLTGQVPPELGGFRGAAHARCCQAEAVAVSGPRWDVLSAGFGAPGGMVGMLTVGGGRLVRRQRRRAVTLTLAVLLALVPIWPPVAALPLVDGDEPVALPGEVIVTLVDDAAPVVTPDELPAALWPLVERYGIRAVTPLRGTSTYRLQGAVGADPAALAAAFGAAEGVVAAEPNWLVRVGQVAPNDPLYRDGDQWHLPRINITEAWAITTGSPSLLVAVVDTGIDSKQVDLVGKVAGGYDFIDERPARIDDVGHGTTVASFITARSDDGRGLAGLAPEVRVLSFRTIGRRGGSSFDTARGVIAAVDAGARVVNCSFGGPAPALAFQRALDYAARRGVVVIASSGNGGTARLAYPAALPRAIAIGASNWRDEVAGFSQRGSHVAVVAPGAGVLGAVAGGHQAVTNGTSFSAPIVSGVVALMLSVNPSLTPEEVRRILEGTADDLGEPGFDPAAGWGRVNAGRAVAAARDGDTRPNRRSVIQGRINGIDPATVVISVEPFGEVIRPAADGTYELSDRGRTTYTLRATASGAGVIGPVSVATSGQADDVQFVNFDFGP